MTRKRTLKQSLVVSHILVSLAPLLFITVFIILYLFHSISEESMIKIGMLAQGTRGQIELFTNQPLNTLNNIKEIISDPAESERIQKILNSNVQNSPYFEAIYQLDRSGRIINAGLPERREHYRDEFLGMQLGHKIEFQRVKETGQPQWSDTFLSLSSGKISLTLYTASKDMILAADINLNALAERINRLSRNNVVTMVIDKNGAIIFHPDPELVGKSIMVNDISIVASALQGREENGKFTFLGKKYIGSTSIIEPAGWVSLIAEPIELQQRRIIFPLLILTSGLAAAAVLSVLLALYRSRSLSKPLDEITTQSSIIARGNYSTSLPESMYTELGELSDTISHMAASIQNRENQLLINERKYREFVEHTSNLVLRLDHDLNIVYVNHTIERLTGRSADYATGRILSEFMDEDDFILLTRSLSEWVGKGRTNEGYETRFVHTDGTMSNLLLSLNLHYSGVGDLDDITVIGHDVTSRYKLEQQQREMEKQQQQSQKMELLGLMASGVAHDLNNILAGIINYPELLLLKMAENDPHRPAIESIKKSGERAAAVVADLLTIARNSASVHEAVSINNILSDYCKSPDFKKIREFHPQVKFTLNQDPQLWACYCSKSHIEKTVINLIINGFESIQGEGHVTVSTENLAILYKGEHLEDLHPGQYIAIHIIDTGEGIPQEDIKRIFEPFFSKKGLGRSGTGLGLTVAWSCIREHKGTIRVQSSPEGTHFTVLLPATDEHLLPDDEQVELSSLIGNGETILIVDDEESLREIATNMLSNLNYKAVSVSSGEEALKFLKHETVDLILLDMQMDPGMSGRETFEQIVAFNPGQRALVASGYSNSTDVEIVLQKGAGAFIKKPYSISDLGRAVRNIFNNEKNNPG